MTWLRTPAAFIAAVLVMAILGVAIQTQFVLAALSDIGADVSLHNRLTMTWADLTGLTPTYAGLIALGFAIAFIAGALAVRFTSAPRALVYAGAGAACIAVMLVLMREVFFGATPIAGTRSAGGFSAQLAIGALAGWLFANLTQKT